MERPIETITLDGGWLCLDFVNTVGLRQAGLKPQDYLESWDDFLLWCVRVKLLNEAESAALLLLPPDDLSEIRALRDMLYALFLHYINNCVLNPLHLEDFDSYLQEVYGHTHLRLLEGRLTRALETTLRPERPLWQIALSAETLLLSDKMHRIKACPGCGWLFLDTTKSGSRRWCNMSSCGSQTKARAWYYRKKAGGKG